MNAWQIFGGIILLIPVCWVVLGYIVIEAASGGLDWFFEYVVPVLIVAALLGCLFGGIYLIHAGLT